MATRPAELTVPQVVQFLQEEWRRHESARLQWEKERAVVLGHAERLEDLAFQHQGIVSMLERRINMLETALQQERAHSLQKHGAVPQPLLEQQPISQTTTDAIGFDSPGASKENTEPEMPFSGRKRFSPGFSPLGRRQRKRGEAGTEPADSDQQQPGSARRRQAQRSLTFGASATGQAAAAVVARFNPATDGTGRGESGEANGAVSQPTPNSPNVNSTAARDVMDPGAAPALLSTPPRDAKRQPQAGSCQGSPYAVPPHHQAYRVQAPSVVSSPRIEAPDVPGLLAAAEADTIGSMPPIFAAVLEYAFPEDGDLVALGIHGHGTDQEGGSGSYMAGDRPVLAELEGIVLANPTTKKGGLLEVDLLADDASRIGLSEQPSSKASSCDANPARAASPTRI